MRAEAPAPPKSQIGLSQLHLLLTRAFGSEEPVTQAQRWPGRLTLLTAEPLEVVRRRLAARGFAASARPGALDCMDSWGNHVQLKAAPPGLAAAVEAQSARGGLVGGLLALSEVTHSVRPGAAKRIAAFYTTVLGMDVVVEDGRATVALGHGPHEQTLTYEEHPNAPAANAADVDERFAVHIAVYMPDESAYLSAFDRVETLGLVHVNPRFEGAPLEFASARTRSEALRSGQFRVKDLVDPGDGVVGLVLEHEVRAPSHRSYPLRLPPATCDPSSPALQVGARTPVDL